MTDYYNLDIIIPAIQKAHEKYEKYQKKQDEVLSPVEQHYIESIRELETLK